MSDYVSQYYSWETGDSITKGRLNGNVTNIITGLNGGSKWINVGNIEVNGQQIMDSSRVMTNIASITTDALYLSANTRLRDVGGMLVAEFLVGGNWNTTVVLGDPNV